MGGNPIQFDYSLISILIFPLGTFALAAYLIVISRRYFKRKAMNDRELLQKMDELIKLQKKSHKTS